MNLTYRWVLALARLALSYYYEEVEVHAAAEVPSTGPLLIIANHQIAGIHIEDSRLFRGRVLVNLARPFTIESYAEDYRSDPRATIEALTVHLRTQLAASVLEAENHEDLHLAGIIEKLDLVPASEP